MKPFNNLYLKVKPIFHTFLFEITLNIKKFIIFSSITILLLIFSSYLVHVLSPFGSLPTPQAGFYDIGIMYFNIIAIFAVCFFFSGIICSEYKNKTGLIVLPLINKYKLIIGKYLANSILVIGIAGVHYLAMILLGYYFYGGPILNRLILSFGFVILYIFALGSIVTFFSSFMSSETPVIIAMSGLVLFGFEYIIDPVIMAIFINFEPNYSLSYLYKITRWIIYPDYSTMDRYIEETIGNITFKRWFIPSIEGALIFLLLYSIIFFILASILFKKREL